MTCKIVKLEGEDYAVIPTIPCANRFQEEMDYDFLEQMNGESIAIP